MQYVTYSKAELDGNRHSGGDMEKRMTWADRDKWLFKFANFDYEDDEPSDSDKSTLRQEWWDFSFRKRSQPLPHGGTLTRISPGGIKQCTWNDVLESNQRAHRAIHALADKTTTPKWSITFNMVVDAMDSHGEITQETSNSVDAFTLEMCIVLARMGGKIGRCMALKPIPPAVACKPKEHPHEVCGKLFLRGRKDKNYCDNECRVREAMRRRRAKDREEKKAKAD
jgi:hypothetical protein